MRHRILFRAPDTARAFGPTGLWLGSAGIGAPASPSARHLAGR